MKKEKLHISVCDYFSKKGYRDVLVDGFAVSKHFGYYQSEDKVYGKVYIVTHLKTGLRTQNEKFKTPKAAIEYIELLEEIDKDGVWDKAEIFNIPAIHGELASLMKYVVQYDHPITLKEVRQCRIYLQSQKN